MCGGAAAASVPSVKLFLKKKCILPLDKWPILCYLITTMNDKEQAKLERALMMALAQLDQLEAMLEQTQRELGTHPAV